MATTYVGGWIDNNGAPGYGTIPGKGQGIYDESSTQNMALGSRVELSDGRVFRYSYFSTATGLALLAGVDQSVGAVVDTDNVVVAPASSQTVTDGTVGYKFVEITLASVSANQYAGAYLMISDGAGAGNMYRIKGNTATDDPASGNIRVEFFDKIKVLMGTDTDFAITAFPYANLIGATAATDMIVSGATMVSVTVDYYAFVQTWGSACVLADGNTSSGDPGDIVTLSDGVTGAYQLLDAYTEQIVGTGLFQADDTTYGGIFLTLSP